MSLYIEKLSHNGYTTYQNKKTENVAVCNANINFSKDKLDKSKDGKFSTSEAMKNFGKGLISPITSMFSSPKNIAIGAGMIAGSMILLAATGGAAAPILVAAGIGMGVIQAGNGVYKIIKAKNNDDVEKAFYDIGGATSTIGLSMMGAKSSLKQANIKTDGLNFLTATQKCFNSSKSLATESFDVFKSGYYRANLNNALKFVTQPRSLRKFSNELFKEGQEHFEESFNAVKEALPEEFRTSLKGRSKCELSIYEKLVKERTIDLNHKIKKVKNCADFSDEIKQIKISKLLAEKKEITRNKDLVKDKVQDLYGARLTLNDVNPRSINKIITSLVNAIKKGDIEILKIKNYRGANSNFGGNTEFYFSEAQVRKIQDISGPMECVFTEKHSGYTATQMNIRSKSGAIIELQIRGEHVHDLAKIEHIPYDLREGKDIAKGNNQIGIILARIQKAIKKLNEEQFIEYEKYIYNRFVYAQAKEFGKSATKPTLPDGTNPILSVENLEVAYKQAKSFAPGSIKLPFNLNSQIAFATGIENLSN